MTTQPRTAQQATAVQQVDTLVIGTNIHARYDKNSGRLFIEIDTTQNNGRKPDGKMDMVASSAGFQSIEGLPGYKLNLWLGHK